MLEVSLGVVMELLLGPTQLTCFVVGQGLCQSQLALCCWGLGLKSRLGGIRGIMGSHSCVELRVWQVQAIALTVQLSFCPCADSPREAETPFL